MMLMIMMMMVSNWVKTEGSCWIIDQGFRNFADFSQLQGFPAQQGSLPLCRASDGWSKEVFTACLPLWSCMAAAGIMQSTLGKYFFTKRCFQLAGQTILLVDILWEEFCLLGWNMSLVELLGEGRMKGVSVVIMKCWEQSQCCILCHSLTCV